MRCSESGTPWNRLCPCKGVAKRHGVRAAWGVRHVWRSGGNAAAAVDGSWTLPERWLKARATMELETPFNFIYACDTVGGNSGSPVVNTKGEFVGINFDSVLEGQGGYYVYDADTKRAVAVDARAILQSLDKVMGAPRLVRELTGR